MTEDRDQMSLYTDGPLGSKIPSSDRAKALLEIRNLRSDVLAITRGLLARIDECHEEVSRVFPKEDVKAMRRRYEKRLRDARRKKPKAPKAALANQTAKVSKGWNELRQAFRCYKKRTSPSCSGPRVSMVFGALEEAESADVGISAYVHGYVWFHRFARAQNGEDGWDPNGYFTPETVLRPSNRTKYLEAYQDAVASSEAAPFVRADGSILWDSIMHKKSCASEDRDPANHARGSRALEAITGVTDSDESEEEIPKW